MAPTVRSLREHYSRRLLPQVPCQSPAGFGGSLGIVRGLTPHRHHNGTKAQSIRTNVVARAATQVTVVWLSLPA